MHSSWVGIESPWLKMERERGRKRKKEQEERKDGKKEGGWGKTESEQADSLCDLDFVMAGGWLG